jgi:uncharacterized protein YbbC (DUF1343 family)
MARILIFLVLFVALIPATSLRALDLGIDRLQQMNYAPLAGKRVGLITNQTGVNSQLIKTRLLLRKSGRVNLCALFSPEHGLDGTEPAGKYVPSRKDPATGLVVHSLYGPTRKPTPQMLKGLDVLVFDMQDIGCRSYTYISTMARCMEAAGEAGLEFMVLDRPNPLGGLRIEGPPMESRWISFIGQLPIPYVHGMTVGELARMTNHNGWTTARCKLSVVEMRGWQRSMEWHLTGLRWVQTSPNIPRASSPMYYVATGMAGELAGLDTGVGGPSPFEFLACRAGNAEQMSATIQKQGFPGIELTPYRSGPWQGVRLRIQPGAGANLTALGIHLLAEANRASKPNLFLRSPADKLDLFFKSYGSQSIRSQLEKGVPAEKIVAGWRDSVTGFASARKPYLLYP